MMGLARPAISMIAFSIASAVGPNMALAQQPNCDDPRNQQEMNICAGLDYKAADAELNAAYNKATAFLKNMDKDLPPELKGGEKALRDAQRAWITYRDKACEAHGFQARGGSMESMLVGGCLARVTKERTQQLKDLAGGLAN